MYVACLRIWKQIVAMRRLLFYDASSRRVSWFAHLDVGDLFTWLRLGLEVRNLVLVTER